MTQVLALGAAGSALGVALAAAVIAAVPSFVGDVAGSLQIEYGLSASAVEQGLAIGVLVSLLFSVVPLLEVRQVKPSLLLRNDVPPTGRIDWLKWGVTARVAAALVGVAAWQAGSLRGGPHALGRLRGHRARAARRRRRAHLGGAAAALLALVRAAPGGAARRRGPATRRASSCSPSASAAFFILGVRVAAGQSARATSRCRSVPTAPDMFLIDIQPDQRDGCSRFLDAQNGDAPPPRTIPGAARPRRRA